MQPYQFLAQLYDSDWGNFILQYLPLLKKLDEQFHLQNKKILDTACGTGNLAAILTTMGCEVSGFDRSPEMLSIARKKDTSARITFFQDEMCSFDQGSAQFDFVFNTFDSINYLLVLEEVAMFFSRVFHALKPDGLFIFDINTVNAFGYRHIGTFNRKINGHSFIQRQSFDENKCLETTIFLFQNGEEIHIQRGYTKQEIDFTLAQNGFKIRNCLHAFKFTPGDDDSERLLYVASKIPEYDVTNCRD